MKNHHFLTIVLAALLLTACGEKPTTTAPTGFTEDAALDFLYRYMPLGDSVDYPREYHQECVRYAFKAREEMPWGKDIPEREFKHFVLPERVNNENLDRFRATYYDELKDRVEGLSLYDAVLEVNHWCHEHVNYKGSDSRTSAPMATIKTSWGRCGEESTLLVTALRTVGIPARQVYTPRWAHCDDNHAWVEAWVDGQWHFLGACEPEPVLDLGWFNEPASRALLLHTRVFGDYDGPEEVISRTPYHTEINVVDNYGKTAKTTFTVVDATGTPLPDVKVEFKIYNYAEFCTVVAKTTDELGQTWLTAGLGTMMAYAAKDGKFGFQVFRPGLQDQVTLTLDHQEGDALTFDFDMIPPAPSALAPEVTPEMRAINDRRVAQEDSIRNAYINSCKEAQRKLIMNTGNKTLCSIYEKTWGNYQTIADFIQHAQEKGQEVKAVSLLQAISDKDLRDISLEVLVDHLDHTPGLESSAVSMPVDLYQDYILNPRVSNEMIVTYRKTLSEYFSQDQRQAFHDDPASLVGWVKDHLTVADDLNPQRIPISPVGVLKSGLADRHSRDIFFVAMARSLGIAAQIHPVTGQVQYFDKRWTAVDFEAPEPTATETGYLDLKYKPSKDLPNPKYYTHFSLKKFDGHSFRLLAYDAQDPGIDDGMTLAAFEHPTPLEAGYYILTTGTRLDDGTALTHSQCFSILPGKTTPVKMTFRSQEPEAAQHGKFNSDAEFSFIEVNRKISFREAARGRTFILALLDASSEPTTHAMQDMRPFREAFDLKGLPIIFLYKDFNEYRHFMDRGYLDLPGTITYGTYEKGYPERLAKELHLDNANLPIFLIADPEGHVSFLRQGYTIGLGEQLIKNFN